MRIQIRHADDWVAVYKDGVRVVNEHSCPLDRGLEALDISFESICLDDQLDEYGNMKDGEDPFPERI